MFFQSKLIIRSILSIGSMAFNAFSTKKENEKQRSLSRELAEKREEFERAQDEQNQKEAAKLQQEMLEKQKELHQSIAETQAQNARELQEKQLKFQRDFQENADLKSREFQKLLAEKQNEFQKVLQEQNMLASAQLQRELAQLEFQNALYIQQKSFDEVEKRWEKEQFFRHEWPLTPTPQSFIERIKHHGFPLQIIFAGKLNGEFYPLIRGTARFLQKYYAPGSASPVYCYDGGWKEEFCGNAQIEALHKILAGVPTLVLTPQISRQKKFLLEASFWGLGKEQPVTEVPVTFDMNLMERQAIRQITREYKKIPNHQSPEIRRNLQILEEERARRDELKRYNQNEEEIWNILSHEFTYSTDGFENQISEKCDNLLTQVLDVTVGGFADIYNMLTLGTVPQMPRLLSKFEPSLQKHFGQPFLANLFENIGKPDELPEPQTRFLLPRLQVLSACSFSLAGDSQTAEYLQDAAYEQLNQWYAPQTPQKQIPEEHYQLLEVLGKAAPREENCRTFNIQGTEYRFRWCPPGTLRRNERANHAKVEISRGFWLLETPVTQKMWYTLMGPHQFHFEGEQNPANCVTWPESQQFCQKFQRLLDDSGLKVSLPTEIQWEYACMAGLPPGNYAGTLEQIAWCGQTTTKPVGQKRPNRWQIYDMMGNVWEWCNDSFAEMAPGIIDQPSRETSQKTSERAVRGGGWHSDSLERCEERLTLPPETRAATLGFRICLQK